MSKYFSVPKIASLEAQKNFNRKKCMSKYFSVPKIASPEARNILIVKMHALTKIIFF